MYIFDPRMFSEWPYLPAGLGPVGDARDHCREAGMINGRSKGDYGKDLQVLRR
jgi:hypothetical protein